MSIAAKYTWTESFLLCQRAKKQKQKEPRGCCYSSVVQRHSGKDTAEGLIVILCRDGALSRPGWLASPTYLADREVFGGGQWRRRIGGERGGGTARRLDVTEITREYEASVSLISRSVWLSDQRALDLGPLYLFFLTPPSCDSEVNTL